MTREEAILCLKGIKNYARDTFTEQADWQTSLDMAIKALEQEPFINKPCVSSGVCEHDKNNVLDQIRVEIEQLPTSKCAETCRIYTCRIHISANDFKKNVLKILDKYKAESEDEE